MNELEVKIKEVIRKKGRCIIAIDGRCGSGKSTFANYLSKRLHAPILHMDDFFLRPEQRTKKRYETPGGNVDHERIKEEVLIPYCSKQDVIYHPFDCNIMQISEEEKFFAKHEQILIVEGTYSFHPELSEFMDIHFFLSIDKDKQLERIRKRNPDKYNQFVEKWIPLEEAYFSSLKVEEKADYTFHMEQF